MADVAPCPGSVVWGHSHAIRSHVTLPAARDTCRTGGGEWGQADRGQLRSSLDATRSRARPARVQSAAIYKYTGSMLDKKLEETHLTCATSTSKLPPPFSSGCTVSSFVIIPWRRHFPIPVISGLSSNVRFRISYRCVKVLCSRKTFIEILSQFDSGVLLLIIKTT